MGKVDALAETPLMCLDQLVDPLGRTHEREEGGKVDVAYDLKDEILGQLQY